MAHRDAGEARRATSRADAADGERRDARVVAVAAHGVILSDSAAISLEQLQQFARLGAVVERGDELDRLGDLLEVGLQLGCRLASSMRRSEA